MNEDAVEEVGMIRREVTALADTSMSVNEVTQQVALIQQIMTNVMKEGEHYGKIPGCGDKPTLLQSGAQKLGLTFRLLPRYEIERIDLPNGHREYEVVCNLNTPVGDFAGQGVGEATTMESRYRFRTQSIGQEVPKEYWKTRDASLLGGSQYSPKKVNNKWMIMEKIEHDNPADYYNTVKKISKKRAYVDAISNTLACSDLFTQDLEDMKKNGLFVDTEEVSEPVKAPMSKPQAKQDNNQEPKANNSNTISDKQSKLLYRRMKEKDMSHDDMKELVFATTGKDSSKDILKADMDTMLEAIEEWQGHGDAYEGDPDKEFING